MSIKIDDIIHMSVLNGFDSLEDFLESSSLINSWQMIRSGTIKELIELKITEEELTTHLNVISKITNKRRTASVGSSLTRFVDKAKALKPSLKARVSTDDFI